MRHRAKGSGVTGICRALVGARSAWLTALLGFSVLVPPRPAAAQGTDSVFARLERLVGSGDRPGARALADTLVRTLDERTPTYAEALYWRAFTSAQAAEAERDYLRLSIEHPLSPRAADALLALAQLEYARGDRSAARRRFDRLLLNYPTGRHVARASYWSGRLAMEDGDVAAACRSLANARSTVSGDEVELANQITYAAASCGTLPASPDTSGPPGGVATRGATRATPPAAPREYSVQVAAFNQRSEATSLAEQLRRRGLDVRVAGSRAPFRVRIGRYPTRADAAAALQRMRASRLTGIVVEAEPR